MTKATAAEFMQQLENTGTSFTKGAPESPVSDTCQMIGKESVIDNEVFKMTQSEPQQPETALTTGFDFS